MSLQEVLTATLKHTVAVKFTLINQHENMILQCLQQVQMSIAIFWPRTFLRHIIDLLAMGTSAPQRSLNVFQSLFCSHEKNTNIIAQGGVPFSLSLSLSLSGSIYIYISIDRWIYRSIYRSINRSIKSI